MDVTLDETEVRVLGCLMEKEMTTPEYYPLTLNSLVAAVNQKSNRDPVVDWDADVVEAAVDSLRDHKLAFRVDVAGSRVAKYRCHLDQIGDMPRAERALMCVLLLRGAQTPGELRARTERMHVFPSVEAVLDALKSLAEDYGEPLVQQLPRQPGRKEARWCQLLGVAPADDAEHPADAAAPVSPLSTRAQEMADIKHELEELRSAHQQLQSAHDQLRAEFETLRSQFE